MGRAIEAQFFGYFREVRFHASLAIKLDKRGLNGGQGRGADLHLKP